MSSKQMSKGDWLKLLQEGKAFCYFKPNMYVHDSGYRCFEVGYLVTTEDNRRCREKLVLGKYSDHIQLYNYDFEEGKIMPNLDLLLDGHIRVFGFERKPIWWGSLDFVVSSAQLSLI